MHFKFRHQIDNGQSGVHAFWCYLLSSPSEKYFLSENHNCIDQESDKTCDDHVSNDSLSLHLTLSFHHTVAESGTGRNELRSYNGHPAKSDCKSHTSHNTRKRSRKDDVFYDIQCICTHRAGCVVKVFADILHS